MRGRTVDRAPAKVWRRLVSANSVYKPYTCLANEVAIVAIDDVQVGGCKGCEDWKANGDGSAGRHSFCSGRVSDRGLHHIFP